jgi:hypothetical protein
MQLKPVHKIALAVFAALLIAFLIWFFFLRDSEEVKVRAPAPSPDPGPAPEIEVTEIETTKCYMGDDVEINCIPPTGLNGKDYYTYGKVKRGSEESREKVPCSLTTQCIVPPGDTDVVLVVQDGVLTDLKVSGEQARNKIHQLLCEADYNCIKDPIYKKEAVVSGAKEEVMLLDLRKNCHAESVMPSCVDDYFDFMKATAWKPNPELTLSGQALQEVRRMAREKQVPEPSTKLTEEENRTRATITVDQFKNQCEAKGYEFAKNCKTPCSGYRFSGSCPPGISSAPSPAPSAGAPRKEIDQSTRFHIAGMPQVHDYQLSLRRLADHYTVA